MKFAKIREVLDPSRGHETDAGVDLYVPTFTAKYKKAVKKKNQILHSKYYFEGIDNSLTDEIVLPSGERMLVPSGIKANIPANLALIAFNKTGISTIYGIDILGCVIDTGYQGEILISIINLSKREFRMTPGMKLIQLVLVPIIVEPIEIVSESTLYRKKSARGEDGFGSTGGTHGVNFGKIT